MLRSEVIGSFKMKAYLSGMPRLELRLNDKMQLAATRGAGNAEL